MLVNKQFTEGEEVVLKLNRAKDALEGETSRNRKKKLKIETSIETSEFSEVFLVYFWIELITFLNSSS